MSEDQSISNVWAENVTLRDERDRLRRALRIAIFLEGPENVQSEYELWCELVDNGLKEKFNEWYGECVLAALTPAGGGRR